MNDSLKTLLIVAFLIVILWNLGAGLYYMLVDKGTDQAHRECADPAHRAVGRADPAGGPGHLHGLDHAARHRPLTP